MVFFVIHQFVVTKHDACFVSLLEFNAKGCPTQSSLFNYHYLTTKESKVNTQSWILAQKFGDLSFQSNFKTLEYLLLLEKKNLSIELDYKVQKKWNLNNCCPFVCIFIMGIDSSVPGQKNCEPKIASSLLNRRATSIA